MLTVHVQGDLSQQEKRAVFLTVHDLGCNRKLCFSGFENIGGSPIYQNMQQYNKVPCNSSQGTSTKTVQSAHPLTNIIFEESFIIVVDNVHLYRSQIMLDRKFLK